MVRMVTVTIRDRGQWVLNGILDLAASLDIDTQKRVMVFNDSSWFKLQRRKTMGLYFFRLHPYT